MGIWQSIPEKLRVPLVQGSSGRMRLHSLARTALNLLEQGADSPAFPLADFVREAFLAAWEENPLDLNCISPLLDLQANWPCLPGALLKILHEIKDAQQIPADMDAIRALTSKHDQQGLLEFIAAQCEAEPHNLFRLQQAIRLGSAHDLPWLEQRLACAGPVPGPVLNALKGDLALLGDQPALAVRHYMAALRELPLPTWRARLGQSLFCARQSEEALKHWDAALAARPWNAQLFLQADDVRRGRHLPGPLPSGRGVVLLYSWNKAALLDATLASLHASELGGADIVALDNGSSDQTPELLGKWAQRFGPRFSALHLPCNIGAPAARNWLLSLPQIKTYDWLVFLDDDIELPPDWLRFFGAAMAACPQGNVFGCRVVDHDRRHMIQCADFHLEPGDAPDKRPTSLPDFVQRFSLSLMHIQAPQDFGQFSYLRPCVSVTGCCHLFRAPALFATGLFDLRYAPSQFDDFEHDLRHAMRHDFPIYQGYLRVPHLRRTGSYGAGEEPQLANAWANMYKLQMRYSRDVFDAVREEENAVLLADLEARCEQ